MAALLLLLLGATAGGAAEQLDGEFADIDLGRPLITPEKFPTIRQLREAVRKPEIRTVLTLKLSGGGEDHHLPIFSGDGRRLALQRGDPRAESSKLLLYTSLGQAEPTLLSTQPDAYDYMFRWCVNDPASCTFARIHLGEETTHVYASTGGSEPARKTSGTGRHVFPALYGRTDGIWRLVYERDGQVMQQAWDEDGPLFDPLRVLKGTTPRWSRDGFRLLMARQRLRHGKLIFYEMVVRDLRTETDRVLSAGETQSVRSPSWSPDEQFAAFYVRESGPGQPWRIRVCPVADDGSGRTLGRNVVVNLDFDSEGPAWEPGGRRVWFFSYEHPQDAYHPLVAADVHSGEMTTLDYPSRCTTANDLAINPAGGVPEMAFVAHDGPPQDLFILFLNHY